MLRMNLFSLEGVRVSLLCHLACVKFNVFLNIKINMDLNIVNQLNNNFNNKLK